MPAATTRHRISITLGINPPAASSAVCAGCPAACGIDSAGAVIVDAAAVAEFAI